MERKLPAHRHETQLYNIRRCVVLQDKWTSKRTSGSAHACTSSDAQCERHKSGSCSDQDCLHFLPISSVTVEAITLFMCREQVGDGKRNQLQKDGLPVCGSL